MLCDSIAKLAECMGQEAAREHLLPYYNSFLKDTESEVRTSALNKLSEFAKYLSSDHLQSKVVPSFADL